jgi:DNA polymerase III subunit epsilon
LIGSGLRSAQAGMKVRMSLPVLPTYYYLDHFKEMLSFIESTYASVLDNEHHAFIHQFRRLTPDEQCLFVRLTNRRGNVFGVSHLRYSEIGDVPAAIEGLRSERFLSDLTAFDAEEGFACFDWA